MPGESKVPERVGSTESLDPYEAQHMATQGVVVLQTKTRTNWHAPAYAGGMALFILVWCATHAHLGVAMGLGVGAVFMLIGLFFAVLRIKVTTEYVDIHYGLIGPKIPLDSIESVKAIVHRHRSFLRWGISPLGRGKWLYSVAGDKGRAVEIVWRGPKGDRRVHIIGSPDHEDLASSIEAARGTRSLVESSKRPALSDSE